MLNDRYKVKDREPVSRRVYRNLREAIISGDLPANTRIVEGEFAKELGVSRTPLREALFRLETDGLVSLRPGAGYSINDTQEQLVDIFHLRKALEGYVTRLVAESASPDLIGKLRDNLARHQALDLSEVTRRAQLNEDFHNLITDACGSERLRRRVRELREFSFGPSEMELHPDQGTVRGFLVDHEKMVRAIEVHDGDAAEQLMRDHLDSALELLLKARAAWQDRRDSGSSRVEKT